MKKFKDFVMEKKELSPAQKKHLDVDDDNVPKDPVIMHWTGSKGKDIIRSQMNA